MWNLVMHFCLGKKIATLRKKSYYLILVCKIKIQVHQKKIKIQEITKILFKKIWQQGKHDFVFVSL